MTGTPRRPDVPHPEPQHEEPSLEPRTGRAHAVFPTSTDQDVDLATARAESCARRVAASSPAARRTWLSAVAASLEEAADHLVAVADRETGLGAVRLSGELARTASQLRFYGTVAADGAYLGATIDRATESSPWLGRVHVPVGPVAVFGASNFPFAFGVLGNDTASAIAAGCPVVAKGHPAHPETSRLLAAVAIEALARAGAPDGTFGLVTGFAAGTRLVDDPAISAVAFTGSQSGGMALRDRALARPVPIAVYAEMGTVNPVVVTAAGADDLASLAAGFVGSFTLGSGQFCTKPGLLLAPAGRGIADAVAQALRDSGPSGWALTGPIAEHARAGVAAFVAAGAEVLQIATGPAEGFGVDAVLLRAEANAIVADSPLVAECFGPVAIIVEYRDDKELAGVLGRLQGALVGTIIAGGDDPDLSAVIDLLSPVVGRITVGDWPTGVAWTWAQHHGGPWPATSDARATSVGAAALDRFTRPLALQSVPEPALPPSLQDSNPWHLPRRIDGVLHLGGGDQ
ncbi:aldehyde dehydrogenase family protein [Aeromicrobium sp. JJY06]|uniref:aldehyde dehydrogenase family protein n=1 Tax=Aeromicrobium sp. JJY06 TaxID=3373478 RepID=UPI00376EF1BA